MKGEKDDQERGGSPSTNVQTGKNMLLGSGALFVLNIIILVVAIVLLVQGGGSKKSSESCAAAPAAPIAGWHYALMSFPDRVDAATAAGRGRRPPTPSPPRRSVPAVYALRAQAPSPSARTRRTSRRPPTRSTASARAARARRSAPSTASRATRTTRSTLPPPKGETKELLKCLLVDSWYDSYLGVIILARVIDGTLKKNMKIKMMSTDQEYIVEKVGVFTPKAKNIDELKSGEIGFIITGIKNLSDTKVGDTICEAQSPIKKALPGFKPSKPVVFCGLFPVDSSEYQKLKDGLAKLQLNDSSFSYEAESSSALGLGFRCGFLGLLHLEIITERLEREFDINLLTTTPGVVYKVHLNNGNIQDLQNPSNLPDPTLIKFIEEPWIKATIITPDQYLGAIMKLCQNKRGIQKNLNYSGNRAVLNYEIPLNEVVFDFNDRLKSMTSGYASFDYEIMGHKEGDLVKLGILVNSEPVDALAMMVHKDFAPTIGREVCEKLKDLIPRHNFMIPVQAAIGGKIIARETIKGFKKDVLTKIHGGGARDRKRKLLDKQKKGKSRSKQFGRVEIPQEAFIGVLKINKEN